MDGIAGPEGVRVFQGFFHGRPAGASPAEYLARSQAGRRRARPDHFQPGRTTLVFSYPHFPACRFSSLRGSRREPRVSGFSRFPPLVAYQPERPESGRPWGYGYSSSRRPVPRSTFSGVMGRSRQRYPVALYTASAMAGAVGETRPSPASLAPNGPSGSNVSTQMDSPGGMSSAAGIL